MIELLCSRDAWRDFQHTEVMARGHQATKLQCRMGNSTGDVGDEPLLAMLQASNGLTTHPGIIVVGPRVRDRAVEETN